MKTFLKVFQVVVYVLLGFSAVATGAAPTVEGVVLFGTLAIACGFLLIAILHLREYE